MPTARAWRSRRRSTPRPRPSGRPIASPSRHSPSTPPRPGSPPPRARARADGIARAGRHDALCEAYEPHPTALLQRQDFGGARQLLREALDDPTPPAVRAAGFRGLFSTTFGAEVGALTAQAILGMQEGREAEALEALKKAEVVLASIPGGALPQTRPAECDT